MGEVLSAAEIRARFPWEWVLLEDPEISEVPEVRAGRVLWNSKDRDEVHRKARELKPAHSAVLYTGGLPEKTAIVL